MFKRLILVFLFQSAYPEYVDVFPFGLDLETIMDRIEINESNGIHNLIGDDGEFTSFQIKLRVLKEYNISHKTKYTKKMLLTNKKLARKIATWAFLWNWWHTEYIKDQALRLVVSISSYNTGYGKFERQHLIMWKYVRVVSPQGVIHVFNNYRFRMDGKRMYLKLKFKKRK